MLYQHEYLQIVILNLLQLRHSFLTITAQNAHLLEIHICLRNYLLRKMLVLKNYNTENNSSRLVIILLENALTQKFYSYVLMLIYSSFSEFVEQHSVLKQNGAQIYDEIHYEILKNIPFLSANEIKC